jgi:hypothetical protein
LLIADLCRPMARRILQQWIRRSIFQKAVDPSCIMLLLRCRLSLAAACSRQQGALGALALTGHNNWWCTGLFTGDGT